MSEPSLPLKRMACVACTKAKRKCSKQTPACRRCIEKQSVCQYPAPRRAPPYHLVFAQDGAVTTVPAPETDPGLLPLADTHEECSGGDGWVARLSPTSTRAAQLLKNPWFLAPPSWTIDHSQDPHPQINFSDAAITHFVGRLHAWLKQWTTEGHCPFIHSSLYQTHLPDLLQDAFTTLTAYQARTPATEKMILRIVEQRANRLVAEQTRIVDDLSAILLDPAAHLARMQALLIYKVIRLFDGDIRARAQAEHHIDIMSQWASQLWQSAQLTIASGQTKEPLEYNVDGSTLLQLKAGDTLSSTWRAWGFAESIRRTYLTATLTQAVFLTLKQGWAPCPGGIVFTAGRGLWDAPQPYAWLNEFRPDGVIAIRCIDGSRFLEETVPSDVDEFTHATMIVSFGLETFQEWSSKEASAEMAR